MTDRAAVGARTKGAQLRIRDISVRYGALKALDGVSLSLAPNEVTAIIGTNGSGKTTLLNAVSGLVPIASGCIELDGFDLAGRAHHRRARMGIGRTFQHARIVEEMSISSNVLAGATWLSSWSSIASEWLRLPRWCARMSQQNEEVHEILRRCGVDVELSSPAASLPFGQRKIVDLARALAGRPRLLIMDEPTAGLSQGEVNALQELVLAAAERMTVLLVAHHMGFVSRVADHVVCLESGRAIASGGPSEVQQNPEVLKAYVGTEA